MQENDGLTVGEVAMLLGMRKRSVTRVARLQPEQVGAFKTADGHWRFKPSVIYRLRGEHGDDEHQSG
jgi:hypothetical protein